MCGIAGILNIDLKRPVVEEALIAMRDTLIHRGPDGAGIFIDGPCGLGHRRLAIIDLSDRALQPFRSADGRFILIFNGEIFNYRELRQSLQADGVAFRSESDTEVLLQLFIKYGGKCLDRLNGMFAFAIWDVQERTLFLARDRVGVKPLYYAMYERIFYFASEPKALFAAGLPLEINHDATDELLLFKYVAGEQTVFKNVKRLLPGHQAWIKNGVSYFSRWWNLPEKIECNRENLPSDPYAWFEETFYSSVKYRTISDVPVGLMLSGGLDSSSVAAGLHHNEERSLESFTYVFDDPLYNEEHLAKEVSSRFGLVFNGVTHHGEHLVEDLKEAAWLYDEPLVHQNDAQMLALAKVAKRKVTVLLSGEGADELMGGYVRYKPLNHHRWLRAGGWAANWLRYLPSSGIVNRFDKLTRYLVDHRLSSLVLLNASNLYPSDLKALGISINLEKFEYRQKVLCEATQLFPHEPARQAMYGDMFIHMASLLDRNDRMTMGASIECRVPFLDYRLLEMIPAMPSKFLLKGEKGKWLLYQSIGRHLPRSVRKFRKLGFSVPSNRYFELKQLDFGTTTSSKHVALNTLFPELEMSKIFGSTRDPRIGELFKRQLMMLDLWLNHYVRRIR